jgi:hypothetical protein
MQFCGGPPTDVANLQQCKKMRQTHNSFRGFRFMSRLRLPPPSLPDLLFATLGLAVPLLLGRQLLNSDGDLGRHLRVGGHILEHGLLHRDIFSFTKYGDPFIGYEWLSEILFSIAHRLGGLPLVSVCCGLLIATTYAYVASWLLREGTDPLLAYLTGNVAALLGGFHWLARPHLFTLLGVALVVGQLERRGEGAPPWTYLPLFGLWANLHGGFLFGLILIAVYLVGDLAEGISGDARGLWLSRARRHAASLAFGTAGTLLTPYGLSLPAHVLGWFRNRWVIDNTQEYLSPDFHAAGTKVILAVLLLVVFALSVSRSRPSYPRLFVILSTVAAALIYQRNVPLFGLAALPVLARHLDAEWRRYAANWRIRLAFERESPGRKSGPWAIAITVPLLLLTLRASPLSAKGVVPAYFDSRIFPVTAVEKARAARLTGRIYNDFIWGGYILHAWPEQKVFIDGQTDFYGERLTRDHTSITNLIPGWRRLLGKWDVGLVIVPGQGGLAHELVRDPRWKMWYCDSTAVILQRQARPDSVGWDPVRKEQALFDCAPTAR